MLTNALQSATIQQLLQAVGTVLLNGNGVVPGIGIDQQYISICYSDYRIRSAEPYEITYAILPEEPTPYHGAGRLGHTTVYTLVVTLYVRQEIDEAGDDSAWASDTDWGAFVVRNKIVDVLQDTFLFASYDPVTFLPTGSPITIEGLQQLPSPAPTKPQVNSSGDSEDVGGYGQVSMYFSIKSVQPLSVQT